MKTKIGILCMLGILLLNCSVHAEPANDDKWEYKITLYSWLAGQKGSVATLPGLPSTEIDVDFYDDILGNINGALFLNTEMRKGRWGIMADIAYTDIEDETATPYNILWQAATTRTKSWIVSAAGQYRIHEDPRSSMDIFGGIRYWSVDSGLSMSGGPARDRAISNKEDWVDPIVGLKGLSFLGSSKFFTSYGLAAGGFDLGSDFMWDAWGNLGYQWTKTFGITLGYRYMDVDYKKDDFLYDVSQDGLTMGLSWNF